MDYLLNPIICVIWCSQAARNILPGVPFAFWAIAFALAFTFLNTRGIQASSRVNAILTLVMTVVVVVFLGEGVRYIMHTLHPTGAALLLPFYDPATFHPTTLFRGTSVAVLTYIGFDGISTMAEEVENPRRNILLATVLTCLVIGILSAVEVYTAQLAWPSHQPFPESVVDTAFVQIAARIGGPYLFQLLNATLLIANMGSGIAAQFGASRLLYSMGRSGSLPRFFGAVDERHHVPRNNVLLVGGAALAGAFLLTYEQGAELLNFGAFIAFIGVNAAALVHYRFRSKEHVLLPALIPALGILICVFIWLHLNHGAQLLGAAWLAVGLVVAWLMRRSRRPSSVETGT
jgi:amino acid transporter